MRERTIILSGFSKTFSVTGWRLGYVTADAKWLPAMAYFHDLTYVCAPSAFQHAAAAGLEQLPPSFYTQLAADHESKRARMLSACTPPASNPPSPPAPITCWPTPPGSPAKPLPKRRATCSRSPA